MPDTDFPGWICWDCAPLAGGRMDDGHLCTACTNTCGVCGQEKGVTDPGDWGLLRLTSEDWRRVRLMVQQRQGGG